MWAVVLVWLLAETFILLAMEKARQGEKVAVAWLWQGIRAMIVAGMVLVLGVTCHTLLLLHY